MGGGENAAGNGNGKWVTSVCLKGKWLSICLSVCMAFYVWLALEKILRALPLLISRAPCRVLSVTSQNETLKNTKTLIVEALY